MNNKIPPPVYLVIAGILMWFVSGLPFDITFRLPYARIASLVSIGIGAAVAVIAVWQFRQAHTTIDPLRPARASTLVDTGIFRVSRNPMYLGMAIVLLGLVIRLGSVYAAVILGLFVWTITQVQIKPEEAVLDELFGEPYLEYCRRVRRWL